MPAWRLIVFVIGWLMGLIGWIMVGFSFIYPE